LPLQLKLNILLFHQAAAYFKMKLILVPVDEKNKEMQSSSYETSYYEKYGLGE
jgi:hypothetical protein